MSQERRNRFRSSLEKVHDKICSNIYTQLLLVEQVRPFKRIDADLMMKQNVVCGLLGYFEFLTPHRLAIIKRRQRPKGCYGEIESEEELDRKTGLEDNEKTACGERIIGYVQSAMNENKADELVCNRTREQ